HVEDAHDVRVMDGGTDTRFLQKALPEVELLAELRMQKLQRHARAEQFVVSLVHTPHPAVANQSHHAVLAVDDLADIHHAPLLSTSTCAPARQRTTFRHTVR